MSTGNMQLVPNLLNILIWIPLLLFVIPGYMVLWLYRSAVEFLATKILKRNNFRPPNSKTDSVMCQDSSYTRQNTNAFQVWQLKGPWISASEFSSHFHKCFLEGNHDKYRNLYAHTTTFGGYSFYAHCKPEELDLNWHIREYKLSDYGHGTLESWSITWSTTNTYEVGRPLWQVAILHLGNVESGTVETGIVAKLSHALIDGYSFIHIVSKLTENPAPYVVKDRTFTWKDKAKYIFKGPRDILPYYGDIAFSRDSQSPFKKVNFSSKSHSWLMSFATLNLSSVKAVRKATNSHFVCLMMAAQFGALRRLLLETMTEDKLPENLFVSSSLSLPSHPQKLTNHWTLAFFKCPLRIADPIERLQSVEAYYRHCHEREFEITGFFTITALLRIIPAWARRLFLHYDFATKNTSLFSASLMLSGKKHYLLGREVKKLYLPLALTDVIPIALYGVTTSHSGQIDVSISGCSAVVKS